MYGATKIQKGDLVGSLQKREMLRVTPHLSSLDKIINYKIIGIYLLIKYISYTKQKCVTLDN